MSSECWKCGKPAVIHREYEGKSHCAEHFVEQFESNVKETVRKENLFDHDDKVCVALSGGMDSTALLYFLNKLFEDWRELELIALSIDEGIEGYRSKSLEFAEELCEELNVEHHIFSFKDVFDQELDEMMEDKEHACTYCGVFRRWILNKKARDLEATKLTTGHNLDDELQSVFMNYLKGDMRRMARLGAKPAVVDNEKFVPRVKPFRNVPEREVALYGKLNDLELHQDECPYVEDSLRFEVRDFLNKMEENHPSTKFTSLRAFDKLLPIIREKYSSEEVSLNKCEECGEPTSGNVCKTCQLLEEV